MNFRLRHTSIETGREWQLIATDNQDSGGKYRDIKGTTEFTYSHTNSDETIPYSSPINTGEVSFGLWIEDVPFDNAHNEEVYNDLIANVSLVCPCNSGSVDILEAFTDREDLKGDDDQPENIVTSMSGMDDRRYQVSLQYKDPGNSFITEWRGWIIPDLTTYEEDSKPYRANFVARDFSVLSGDYVSGGVDTNYLTISKVFSGILDDIGLNRPIKAVTTFTNEEITTADCYLHQTYMRRYQLQDGTGSEKVQISKKEALERLLKNHNLILYQSEGYFWLVNMTGMANANSVFVTEYNTLGEFVSDDTVDLSTTPSFVTTSKVGISPAIKTVKTRYQHNSTTYGINFEDYWQTNASTDKVFSGVIVSTGVQTIDIYGAVEATETLLVENAQYEVKIQAGQYYWDGEEWTTSDSSLIRKLYYKGTPDIESQYGYTGIFSVQTSVVPTSLSSDDLTITFFNPTHNGGDFSTATFSGFEFAITDEFELPNDYIDYRESNTGNLSVNYDIGTIYYGDRITYNGLSGFKKNSTDFFDVNGWKRRGETLESSFQRLLILDILNFYKDTKEIIRGETFSNYLLYETITYDSKDYFCTSVSLNIYTGRSTLTMIETLTTTDPTDGIIEIPGKPSNPGLQPIAGAIQRSNYISPSGELRGDVTIESGGSSGTLSSQMQYLNADGELTELITAGTADFIQTIASRPEFSAKQNNVPSKSQVFLFSYDGTGGLTDNRISGFSGGSAGKLIRVINVGSNSIVLSANDTGSTAGNRILGSNVTLQQYEAATLIYIEDFTGTSPTTTIDGWIIVGKNN